MFDLSPFQECLLNDSFEERKHKSGVFPFKIAGEEFNNMVVLVDNIYEKYAQFMKGIKIPSTAKEEIFTQ